MDHTDSSRDFSELLDRFDRDWGKYPDSFLEIDSILESRGPAQREKLAVELACIDLERRLRVDEPTRVEDYLRRFPEVARRDKNVRELILTEYRCRLDHEVPAAWGEYLERFPIQAGQLTASEIEAAHQDSEVEPPLLFPDGSRYGHARYHGRGGQAAVYVAKDALLDREVAVKRVRFNVIRDRGHTVDASAEEIRLVHESQLVSSLSHPGVIPTHDLVRDASGRPCLVMKFVGERRLRDEIREFHCRVTPATNRPDFAEAVRPIVERLSRVGETMAYVHEECHIVHRDLKPENVACSDYGETLIMDWGIAKRLNEVADPDPGHAGHAAPPAVATVAGAGTPGYMSPEQARAEPATPAGDIYGVGAILYCVLAGSDPRPGVAASESGAGAASEAQIFLRGAPPALTAICVKAMRSEPENRYLTMAELSEDLKRWLTHQPVLAYRGRETIGERLERNRRRFPLVVPVVLFACASIAIISVTWVGILLDRQSQLQESVASETRAREKADQSRLRAERAESNRRAQLIHSILSEGRNRTEEGDVPAALRHFAQAALIDDETAERRFINELRLARHLEECSKPLRVQLFDCPPVAAKRSRTRPWVLTADSCGSVTIWNHETGLTACGIGVDEGIRSLDWSENGGRVILTPLGGDGLEVWEIPEGRLSSRIAHSSPILKVAISRSGLVGATAHQDRVVRIWNLDDGSLVTETPQHHDLIQCVEFSPDGSRLLSGCGGPENQGDGRGRAWLWNASTGVATHAPTEHQDDVMSICFSPDGEYFASGGWEGTVIVRSTATGEPCGPEVRHPGVVYQIGLHPGNELLLSAGDDGSARLWNFRTGASTTAPMRHLGPVYAASFSDDGDSITTGGFDRTCRFWATSNGRRFGPPIVFPSAVRVVAPVPMFRSVAGSDDGLFRYDDFLELFQMSRFSRVARSLEHLVVHPSGSFLVCVTGRSPPLGFSEHQAIMLDLRCSDCELAPDRISPLRIPHPDAVNWADISADGETIVTGCADGGVYLWNRASGRRVAHGKAHDRPVDKVSFGPRGNQVLSLAFGDHPVLWEGENMAVRKVLRHDQLVCDADWSSDGARVITLAFNGDLHVIDAESGELCSSRTSEHPGYPCVLCRGPGDLFAAAHGPGVVSVVQLTDDRLIDICEIVINQTVTTMSFSPTGDRLAIGTRERIARIWRVPSGEALTPPLEHLDRVNQVSFSPDGLLLATACGGPDRGAEGESRLWDARDGEPVSPWRHHGEDVMRAVFHPSGDRLLTTCWNGQIEFIPVQPRIPRDELLALCHIVSSRQPDDRGEAIVLTHDDYKRYWQIVVDGKTSRFRERANRR